jgi:ABC-type transport system substrate-binding protein
VIYFSSDLKERRANYLEAFQARQLFDGPLVLTLDLPIGLEALGQLIQQDLEKLDVDLELSFHTPDRYEDLIYSGASDFYFMGWKYDLADVADYFESVLVTGAPFNGVSYSNESLDELVFEASQTLDPVKRRELLHDISALALDDQTVLPLFESKLVYGMRPEIQWDLRLDGQILASEIFENVL